jgi:hypothetical protein
MLPKEKGGTRQSQKLQSRLNCDVDRKHSSAVYLGLQISASLNTGNKAPISRILPES